MASCIQLRNECAQECTGAAWVLNGPPPRESGPWTCQFPVFRPDRSNENKTTPSPWMSYFLDFWPDPERTKKHQKSSPGCLIARLTGRTAQKEHKKFSPLISHLLIFCCTGQTENKISSSGCIFSRAFG